MSNPRDEMGRFCIGVSHIVKEECRTTMLHSDMTLSRLMVYAQSIEESKIGWRSRHAKRGRTDELVQPNFKNRAQNQYCSSAPKCNYERGGCSK